MQHFVAILVKNPGRAKSLVAALEEAGLATHTCRNPDELYELVNAPCVDGIILEDQLSGFFRGTELVDRLRQELLQPETLLLGEPSREVRERATLLGIRSILPSDADPDLVCETIQGMLVASSQLGVPLPLGARQLAARADGIRPLPQLLVRLAGYLSDDQASLTELAADISTDAKATADILRLTNSTALGSKTRITRVVDAVTHLGVRRTVALAFSSAIRTSQSGVLRSLGPELQQWLQFRSLLIANVAGTFAGMRAASLVETAYVLGLMQDIGILVMLSDIGSSYQKILTRSQTLGQLYLAHLEAQEYGFTHAEVSAALLLKWQLPTTMIRIIAQHHQPVDGKVGAAERDLVLAAQIADAFADFRDVPCIQRHDRFTRTVAALESKTADVVRNCISRAIAKTLESAEILATNVPPDFEPDRIVEALRDDGAQGLAASSGERIDEPEKNPPEAPPISGSPRIMILDDDATLSEVLNQFLSDLGFRALVVTDPDEAFRTADTVDAILCDVHMPGRSGIEFVRALRTRGYDRPVLMMSGDCRRQTVLEAIHAGAVDFLPKPVSQQTLAEKLARLGVAINGARSAVPAMHAKPLLHGRRIETVRQ